MSNIEFEGHSVIVIQIGSPGIMPQVFVTWTIEIMHRGESNASFYVERSLAKDFATYEVETISPKILGVDKTRTYTYTDITVNTGSFWRKYYYRIKATDSGDSQVSYSPVRTWQSDLKIFEEEIVARQDWILKYDIGIPCFVIFTQEVENNKCPHCFNKSLGRAKKGDCTHCYGTGREQPYLTPVLTYIDFNPQIKQTQVQSLGEIQQGQTNIMWSAFPEMKPGDVIVEIISGKRWRVNSLAAVGNAGAEVLRFAKVDEINRRDVEYKIPIPSAIQKEAALEHATIKAERRY